MTRQLAVWTGGAEGGTMGAAGAWLLDQQDFTSLIVNSVEEGICAFDADGAIRLSNPSAQRMLGWQEHELRGALIGRVLEPPQEVAGHAPAASAAEAVARALSSGESTRCHFARVPRRDGSTFPASCTASPIVQGHEVIGGVLAFHDMTQLTRTQQQLQQLNETLEQRVAERTAQAEARAEQLQVLAAELTQAEQCERRRLAKMLHDQVQQLLVAIKMRLNTLRSEGDGATHKAVDEAEGLLTETIETVRSLSAEIVPPVLYDLGFSAAVDWLSRWCAQRYGLHVKLDAEKSVEIASETMRASVFDALRELLMNIIKHAGVAEARIRIEQVSQRVWVTVEDDGHGFDPAQLHRAPAWTGHGLASLQKRMELMGGQVQVDSAPGRGSRIRIVVPADGEPRDASMESESDSADGAVEARGTPAAAIGRGREMRVLLADDHQVVREGMANMVAAQPSMSVVGEASTGARAVQLAQQLEPDVVIMDISLPEISGIEATRRIKQHLPDTHVLALSMHAEEDVAKGLRAAGAAGFYSKTEPIEKLLAAMRQLAVGASQ